MPRSLPHRLKSRPRAGVQPGGQAFSLVELLVGAALLGLVIGGISVVQLSELNSSRTAQRAIGRSEGAAQAVNLIRAEIAEASNIVITSTSPSTNCPTAPSFVLVGPGASWRIAYGVRARSAGETTLWFGPSVLVRCGLPYNTSGTLDTSGTAAQVAARVAETVVGDRLPAANGLVVTSTGGDATQLVRNIAITLNLQPDEANSSLLRPTSFSSQIGVNRLYGTTDRLSTSDCPIDADGNPTCETTEDNQHFWPTGTGAVVQGVDGLESVVYFRNNRSTYTISNPCTTSSCTVTGPEVSVTITKGDLLVFADQELRL
jgi:type II secretory pathway pseudopilin PulG